MADTFKLEEYNEMSCMHLILTARGQDYNGKRFIKNALKQTSSGNEVYKAGENPQSSLQQRPMCFPHRATLTTYEHRLYLELSARYEKYEPTGSLDEQHSLSLLKNLQNKVDTERQKVNLYLQNNALTVRRRTYCNISQDALKYITEVFRQELLHGLHYPRYYNVLKIIPAFIPASQAKDIPFTFSKVVFKLGESPPPLLFPSDTDPYHMNSNYETLTNEFPPSEIGDNNAHPSKKHISKDNIAHDLSAKYETNVVITLSSLKTLVDNVAPKVEHDWEIPIIVWEKKGVSGNQFKCVFVEKVLPFTSVPVKTIQELYYNYSAKLRLSASTVSHVRKRMKFVPPPIPDDIKPVPKEEKAELDRRISQLASFDDICGSVENACDLDTFGVASPTKTKKPPHSRKQTITQQSNGFNEDHTEKNFVTHAEVHAESGSDEDIGDCDVDFLTQFKTLLMESLNPNTPEVENCEGSGTSCSIKKEDFAPCKSPESDSERLVINCDDDDEMSKAPSPSKGRYDFRSKINVVKNTETCGFAKRVKRPANKPAKSAKKPKIEESSHDDIENQKTTLSAKVEKDAKQGGKNVFQKTSTVIKSQQNNLACPQNPPSKSALDEILMSQHQMLNPKVKVKGTQDILPHTFVDQAPDINKEIAQEYPALQKGNVSYSLLRLGTLKVLIRSEIDGLLSTPVKKSVPTFLFPKLEYQTCFGYEVTTPSELVRQWVSLHTHPGSEILKIRIDAVKSKLSKIEEITLATLQKKEKKINIKDETQKLFITLDALKNLPEGQYLLTHKKGDTTFVILKAVPSATNDSLDLNSLINSRLQSLDKLPGDTDNQKIPWNPIDPFIALREQEKECRIPGCFYPIDIKKGNGPDSKTKKKAKRNGGNASKGGVKKCQPK